MIKIFSILVLWFGLSGSVIGCIAPSTIHINSSAPKAIEMKEIWKDVDGYEGFYKVSSIGRVMSVDREVWNGRAYAKKKGKIRSLTIGNHGYTAVTLNGKTKPVTKTVHRLVAVAFCENRKNKQEVNHMDGDRQNNNYTNLEWVTRSENLTHKYRVLGVDNPQKGKTGRLSHSNKPVLRYSRFGRFVKEYYSLTNAANEVGVNINSISQCCKGKIKTAGGWVWKYKYYYHGDY